MASSHDGDIIFRIPYSGQDIVMNDYASSYYAGREGVSDSQSGGVYVLYHIDLVISLH